MSATRRDVLKGTLGAAALIAVPTVPIHGLSDISTLERLTAEGKYFSSLHQLPEDVAAANLRITLDGRHMNHLGIKEVYCPGDDAGWAVVYKEPRQGNEFGAETEIIRGNWRVERLPA